MTEQQRIEAFRRAVAAAAERFGVDAFAVAQPERLGGVVQVRAVLVFQARPDWKPTEE